MKALPGVAISCTGTSHRSRELSDTAAPEVLTVDELAALLRVNRKTAYGALAHGEIPGGRRVGRAWRISRTVVLEWLGRQGRVPRSRGER